MEEDDYMKEQLELYRQFELARANSQPKQQDPPLIDLTQDNYLQAQEDIFRYWEAKRTGPGSMVVDDEGKFDTQ
jgi:hypothetical protein